MYLVVAAKSESTQAAQVLVGVVQIIGHHRLVTLILYASSSSTRPMLLTITLMASSMAVMKRAATCTRAGT